MRRQLHFYFLHFKARLHLAYGRTQWRIYIVKFWTRAPPGGPNSFNFMQFLGKFGKIVCWRPPGELAPPPRGNPRSATGTCFCFPREVKFPPRQVTFMVSGIFQRGQLWLTWLYYPVCTYLWNVMRFKLDLTIHHSQKLSTPNDWFGVSTSTLASYLINWDCIAFLEWLTWFIKKTMQFNQSDITSHI